VHLWAREEDVRRSINEKRENGLFLPGAMLSERIRATGELAELGDCDLVLAVAPAQHLRAILTAFAPAAKPRLPVGLCTKGIEQDSLKLMSQVLVETLPDARAAVLSGPSFAAEVVRGLPTAVTLACPDQDLGEAIVRAIALPTFRPYLATDIIGAEAGGAIKNVLAIACGVCEGRGLGRSAQAALITRGFAELTRIAVALGGQARTVAGLCGLGDLVLTCSSPQSRNMSVGLALGRGGNLEDSLSGKHSVAEGVASAPAARALAIRLGVDAPICAATAALLAGEADVDATIDGLMSRPLRAEE
jgi:glycerol-3-phosphate dehydrogenase (NAD(P)+)